MSDIAIRVENLSKQYRLGAKQEKYKTLRDTLAGAVQGPVRALQTLTGQRERDEAQAFWALKDVSFEVKRGEVVGIIGRNGAGKSTLLKILSRITEPTSGYADIYGRVASLLEVGTGFHPELTGRENIFLNGAVLGMKREEIVRKFDEIIAFAEVEQFVDTPVKHYSSGMYLRLAFAVAAHLEPEILVVDEVLAVGDAAFQKKCLGKMGEIGLQGRTVLFVSHNMPAMLRLCDRIVVLNKGQVCFDGDSQLAVDYYMRSEANIGFESSWPDDVQAPGDEVARLLAVRVRNEKGDMTDVIDIREEVSIEIVYRNFQDRLRPTAVVRLFNSDGVCLFTSNDYNNKIWWGTLRMPSIVRSTCNLPGNFFAEGRLYVMAAICSYTPPTVHAIEQNAVSFEVVDPSEGDGVRGVYTGKWPGVVRPWLKWSIDILDNS